MPICEYANIEYSTNLTDVMELSPPGAKVRGNESSIIQSVSALE